MISGRQVLINGKGPIVAVASVGVGLGILTATLGGMIPIGQGTLAEAIESNSEKITELRERMPRLEGLFEGHLNREDRQ